MSAPTSTPILVVENYSIMMRILRNLLRQLGFHNVDEAADGATALRKLRDRPYGLAILDWNIRPMSGLDLLRRVRADERLKDMRVLMLTPAEGNPLCCEGADWYLPKPFDAAMLKDILAGVLGEF